MPSILIPIMQYGIPAGIEGVRFLREMLDSLSGDGETMTQEEFNAKWAATRERYIKAGAAWDAAGQTAAAQANEGTAKLEKGYTSRSEG